MELAPMDGNLESIGVSDAELRTPVDSTNVADPNSNTGRVKHDGNATGDQTRTKTVTDTLKCCSLTISKSTAISIIAASVYLIVTIAIGILIVCFKAPKPQDKTCISTYATTTKGTTQYNSRTQYAAIGDFNYDQRLDIAAVNYGSENIGIFLGNGDGTFAAQTTYSTGTFSLPSAIAVHDFNNDTRLDMAVANFGTNNVGIFLGHGNGTFETQMIFSTGSSRPISIAVDDFNNDTRFDVAIAGYGTNSIGILLGLGDGTFTAQTRYSTGYDSDPRSLALGDFNRDNRLDIAFANYGTHNIGILFGNGDGSMGNLKTYSTGLGSRPYSVVANDFNIDNQLDIIVANSGMDNVGVLLGYGNGSFTSQMTFSTGNGSSPHSLTAGDFNNDKILDIAVANTGADNIGVLFGNGNGTFASQVTYSTGYETGAQFVTIGDFNNDSRMDIAVANNDTNNVAVLLGVITADFRNVMLYPTGTGSYPFSLDAADINNDTWLDIVVANYYTNQVGVFLGYDNATFANQITYSTDSGPAWVTIGDFNNDGHPDIVVPNYYANNIGVLLNYGNGTFANQMTYPTGNGSNPNSVISGNFNNDSTLDIVVANYGTNTIGIFLGYGDGTFTTQMTYSTDLGPYSVAVGDFNNDSRTDIVVVNYYAFDIGVFLGYGNGSFASQVTYPSEEISYPVFVTVGDFNNDFRLDIVVANNERYTISVFLGNGDGTFANQRAKWAGDGSAPTALAVADFNNDNRMDVAVANANIGAMCILEGDGTGFFLDGICFSTGGSDPYDIVLGDFNKDNRWDIAVVDPYIYDIGIFLGYDDGKFNEPIEFSTSYGSLPSSLTIGDFNSDNLLDMSVSNYKSNSLGVFFGNGNATFTLDRNYFTGDKSGPRIVISADFNEDNILDLAVTNPGIDSISVFDGYANGTFGNQTLYSIGSGSKPQSLTIGDFNNDNRSDLVVASLGTDSIGILLGYDLVTLAGQLIFPLSGGVNFTSIAIGDFNNDNRSDMVVCDRDSSALLIFLGYGNGSFESQKMYSTGSGSDPIYVAVGDFNNDSRLDIVVANFYANNIDVFLGNGNGTFANQTTYSTSYEPSSVAVGDFNNDSWLDIVVTNYGASNVGIFLGYGNATFSNQTTYATDSGPNSVAVGDFNNDGRLDLVVANYFADSICVLLGYGNGKFENQTTYSTGNGSYPIFVSVGDFNNDNALDIIVANFGTSYVDVFLGYGTGIFTEPKLFFAGGQSTPTSLFVGDFNNDNRLDFVVTNKYNNFVGLWLGYGNGDFSGQYRVDDRDFFSPTFVVGGNFNNDGFLDMAIFDQYKLYVFLGSNVKSFLNVKIFSTGLGSSPISVSVGDFNKDKIMDVVVANSGSGNIGIFLGLGYGVFGNQTTYSSGIGSMPYCVAVGDFDNDGQLDIGVANYGSGNIGIFLGYGNGSFASQMTYFTDPSSNPYSIVVSDINNDRRLDIIIANYGSNYVVIIFGVGNGTFINRTEISMGYDARPGFVAVADLNNDKSLDIAVVNYGSGNVEIISKTC